MTSHYETALTDTRAQLIRLQTRCEELEDQLGKMQLSKRDLLTGITEEKRNTARHFALLQNAEAKAEANARQIQHLLVREQEAMEEKKKLERELDRIHLERERVERERILNIKQENRQR
jgi:hypothetical protein